MLVVRSCFGGVGLPAVGGVAVGIAPDGVAALGAGVRAVLVLPVGLLRDALAAWSAALPGFVAAAGLATGLRAGAVFATGVRVAVLAGVLGAARLLLVAAGEFPDPARGGDFAADFVVGLAARACSLPAVPVLVFAPVTLAVEALVPGAFTLGDLAPGALAPVVLALVVFALAGFARVAVALLGLAFLAFALLACALLACALLAWAVVDPRLFPGDAAIGASACCLSLRRSMGWA
ncbi:MAG: hypothetical protein KF911_09760 [Pseudomonadales bacterium]|nr:hypothetical protein [Pseudomonadales bacterium]